MERTPVHNPRRQLFVLRVIPRFIVVIPRLPMCLLIDFYRNRRFSYLNFRVEFLGIKLKEAVRGVYSLHIRTITLFLNFSNIGINILRLLIIDSFLGYSIWCDWVLKRLWKGRTACKKSEFFAIVSGC